MKIVSRARGSKPLPNRPEKPRLVSTNPDKQNEPDDVALAAQSGAVAREFRAGRESACLFDRDDRGLLAACGADRKTWLHNLVTNTVRTLNEHDGVYAFATDVRGRVQFDLNILCLPEQLWLDVDRGSTPATVSHLDHYLLNEDVRLEDITASSSRLGCTGPAAAEIASAIGVRNFKALPALALRPTGIGQAWLVRHDFAGSTGFELVVPRAERHQWRDRLAAFGAVPSGFPALDALRIEAGIPWLHRDIDGSVLPPETGQAERGISYHKGCYLGQEVLERMRARGALARRLVRLSATDAADLELPAALERAGQEVGRITSLVRHPLHGQWIGLGYLKTKVNEVSGITAGDPPRAIHIDLP